MAIVYLARNIVNGKVYIGQTSTSLKARMAKHKSDALREDGERFPFQNAIRKYGWNNFEWETLEEVEDSIELDMTERYWIRTYGSLKPGGYNLDSGGHFNKKRSPETCEKIRQAQTGRVYSDASRKRMSENRKGRKTSPETKAKMSAARKGVLKSEKHKASLSQRIFTDEHRRKLSEAAKNRYKKENNSAA